MCAKRKKTPTKQKPKQRSFPFVFILLILLVASVAYNVVSYYRIQTQEKRIARLSKDLKELGSVEIERLLDKK